MQSRRLSRESNTSRNNRKNKDESNEVEDVSSQSYADDSGDHSRRSHKTRRSSHSSKKEQRTDEDTEDYFSDIRRKKGASNKKKSKSSGSKDDSTEDVLSDEEYAAKDKSMSERKKTRKRRKSTRTNESNSHESTGERDSSSKKGSAKGKRKKHQQDETVPSEIPITEILKKAQQRTKYEEPAPLAELTASTVYVQDRNGFSAIKIPDKHLRRGSETMAAASGGRPIEVAIVFQKIWRTSGFIFQGLLGGMALLHLIFMETYFKRNSNEFVSSYSQLVEIYGSCFSFLIAMCLISVFDKFDLAHIRSNHLRQIMQYHLNAILALPIYIAAFSLHHITAKVDDKLTLLRYNASEVTYYNYRDVNYTNGDIGITELKTWQRMTLSKDLLAVIGWIFVSIGDRKDMLLEHLESMSKYADNTN